MDIKPLHCKRCGNNDPTFFYYGSKGWYCRKCIEFGRFVMEESKKEKLDIQLEDSQYNLPFKLSDKQRLLAKEIKKHYQNNNILVYAACGSGKTELMLDFISDALAKGYRIGWSIPRRAVVLQLWQRLKLYYPRIKIIPVAQDYTTVVFGDLIICTTHQLYRYYRYFDFLIIDEPDAFPFRNNELLQNIALNSVKGKMIFLTATPDEFVKKHCDITLVLFERPHKRPLPIPLIKRAYGGLEYLILIYLIIIRKRRLLIFVPSRKEASRQFLVLKIFTKCLMITSKSKDKENIIRVFLKENRKILISTTILERGVTLADIDVIVFKADHPVFDLAALMQMAGRVGRLSQYPDGRVDFIVNNYDRKVKECIKLLQKMNKNA